MRWQAAGAASAVFLATLAPGAVRAEEGVAVARLTGGAAGVAAAPFRGGRTAVGSLGLGLTDTLGVVGTAALVGHRGGTTVGLGAGLQLALLQDEWWRLFATAEPQLLLAWDGAGRQGRSDVAVYGGLGFEYLLMWGFGLAAELTGTLPLGLDGAGPPGDAPASVGLHAGVFMEL